MGGVEADHDGQQALGPGDGQGRVGQALQFVGKQLLHAVGQEQSEGLGLAFGRLGRR